MLNSIYLRVVHETILEAGCVRPQHNIALVAMLTFRLIIRKRDH